MSKKAALLLILTMILLFLTGYNISKRVREKKETPVTQSYSHSVTVSLEDRLGEI